LGAIQKSLEEFPEEEMYSKDRPQPPKFKVHLKTQLNLNEDDHCLFEAKLIPVRDPMMRVQWFKNGKVLHHGKKHSSLNIKTFVFPNSFKNDSSIRFR
jgi:hypothetical protein